MQRFADAHMGLVRAQYAFAFQVRPGAWGNQSPPHNKKSAENIFQKSS
jgi:hypothetical protein